MTPVPDATMAALVGAFASLLTVFISKRVDSSDSERRSLAEDRREHDRRKSARLAELETLNAQLRERLAASQADCAMMRSLLVFHDIPIPPSVGGTT